MSTRSGSPPQRQLHAQAAAAAAALSASPFSSPSYAPAARQQSRHTSFSSSANMYGGAPAGTPSRRQHKRSSVTVMWPDDNDATAASPTAAPVTATTTAAAAAVPTPASLPSSRLSSASGQRLAVLSPTFKGLHALDGGSNGGNNNNNSISSGGGGGGGGGIGSAVAAAAATLKVPPPAGAAAIPIPTAPRRLSGPAGIAMSPSSRRQRTSLDATAAPPEATMSTTTTAAVMMAATATAADGSEERLPSPHQESLGGQPPYWMTPPHFAPVEIATTTTKTTPAATNATAAHTTTTTAVVVSRGDRGVVELGGQQQRQQQPSYNTNGVCESIVSGVRYAAGQRDFAAPAASLTSESSPFSGAMPFMHGSGEVGGVPLSLASAAATGDGRLYGGSSPPPPARLPMPPPPPMSSLLARGPVSSVVAQSNAYDHDGDSPSLSAHRTAEGTTAPPMLARPLSAGTPTHMTSRPHLPAGFGNHTGNNNNNNYSVDSVSLFAEKRPSNPFASYSTDLFAGDSAAPGSGATHHRNTNDPKRNVGRGGEEGRGDGGGVVVVPAAQPPFDLSADSGVLAAYQQQAQHPLENQRASAALQRNAAHYTSDLATLVEEARRAYEAAELRLLDDGLSLMSDWMRTRDLFFSAGSLFAAVGDTAAAARCFLHATFINRAFQNDDEALTTLALSVDQLKQAHPRVAVDALLRLAPCYAGKHLRYQAARCYREAAELLETALDEKEAAVTVYRQALDLYAETATAAKVLSRVWAKQRQQQPQGTLAGSQPLTAITTTAAAAPGSTPCESMTLPSLSDPLAPPAVTQASIKAGLPPPHYQVSTSVQRSLVDGCRSRLLVLLTQLQRYTEVLETALVCAENVAGSLPKTKFMLTATLCVLARGASLPGSRAEDASSAAARAAETTVTGTTPFLFMTPEAEAADATYFDSLHDTEKVFSALQEEDRFFQRGKENELVRALLAANAACSLTMFDEAVRRYRSYTTTESNVAHELLLEQCRRSLFEHVERFA